MKILITGAEGFIGKNLVSVLRRKKDITLMCYDIGSASSLLEEYCRDANFVFHLAGVNRPENEEDYMKGNYGFASELLKLLERYHNPCPIAVTSSVQADLDNPYGKSKRAGEMLFCQYGDKTGAPISLFRLPNVFGKWCRPNYNSVIATFCHNITRGLPVRVSDREVNLNLVYIDDVVTRLIDTIHCETPASEHGFCSITPVYQRKLGDIVDSLYSFHRNRLDLSVPDLSDPFQKKLYATYLSYLPPNSFSYPLKMNCDDRGSFTEILRTADRGQFSVNISRPGITKGNHWHHTKNEKFVVVSGKGVIRFRHPDKKEIIEYFVSGDSITAVDIPPGYTHHIENLGDTDLVTFMWCSECFDAERPDTCFLEV